MAGLRVPRYVRGVALGWPFRGQELLVSGVGIRVVYVAYFPDLRGTTRFVHLNRFPALFFRSLDAGEPFKRRTQGGSLEGPRGRRASVTRLSDRQGQWQSTRSTRHLRHWPGERRLRPAIQPQKITNLSPHCCPCGGQGMPGPSRACFRSCTASSGGWRIESAARWRPEKRCGRRRWSMRRI